MRCLPVPRPSNTESRALRDVEFVAGAPVGRVAQREGELRRLALRQRTAAKDGERLIGVCGTTKLTTKTLPKSSGRKRRVSKR